MDLLLEAVPIGERERLSWVVEAMVLVLIRLSGLCVVVPVFSSTAIPVRVRAAFTIAIAFLIGPIVLGHSDVNTSLNCVSAVGEIAVGCTFGVLLALLSEVMAFAGMLIGMQFSFSLVNLLDPNTMIDTPVLGQMFNWIGTLTLLSAGLHRTVIRAFIHTFQVVPLGGAFLATGSASEFARMLSGVFLAGVQLAAPVMAAALTAEVVIALVSRLSPQLPAMVFSIPVKTCVSYVVLIGSLSLWPMWIEQYFIHLLRSAESLVATR